MTDLPLSYVHREPSGEPSSPAPAVFVLHGRGADERDLLPVASQLSEEHHVISLRAPDQLMQGYTWYDLDMPDGNIHESQPDAEGFRRSLDLVAESVDAAVEAWEIDPDRLGLLGFSQGGITSLSLVLENPGRYAWVVALHCYLADSHADLAPDGIAGKPIFVGAGSSDQIIPAERARRAADRLDELDANVTFNVYDAGHGVSQEELHDVVAFVEDRG